MDNLPSKLKALAQNRYFALAAIVFFAFITAFIIALISAGSPTTQELRDQVRQSQEGGSASGQTGSGPSSAKSSLLDRIMAGIGLKKNIASSPTADQSESTKSADQDYLTSVENLTKNAPALPKVTINKYNLKTSLPSVPASIKIYSVKTNYTQAEAEQLARGLGFSQIDVSSQNNSLYELYDLKTNSYLALSKNNGEFSFMSQDGVDTGGQTSLEAAEAFVTTAGLDQDCVRSYATYRRASQPGSTFVEFHCDWNAFGGPIFSSVGVLNLPEEASLASLKVAEIRADAAPDADIIDTSDESDGSKRASDFNTLVVEVADSTNRVLAAASNIPQFTAVQEVSSDKLVPPTDIIAMLESGKAQLSLTTPTGDGFLDLANIYRGGTASASEVEVRDLIYGYDFLPGLAHAYSCPVYFVRSYGALSSGYDSEFIQTVPAVSDARCDLSAVLGATTGKGDRMLAQAKVDRPAPSLVATSVPGSTEDDTLKYGSFRFIPSAQIPPSHERECPVTNFTNAYKTSWDPTLYLAWVDPNAEIKVEGRGGNYTSGQNRGSIANRTFNQKSGITSIRKAREWWAVRVAGEGANLGGVNLSLQDRNQVMTLRGQLLDRCKVGRRDQCPLPEGFAGQIVSCQFLTAASPRLHLYPARTTQMTILLSPLGKLGYTDPAVVSGSWSVTASPDGTLLSSAVKRDSLYWEFEKAPVLAQVNSRYQTTEGWEVRPEQLNSKIIEIASQLGLTSEETTMWQREIIREAEKLNSQFLRLSLLPKDLLDGLLTISIEPKPTNFYRLMLFVEGMSAPSSISAPVLERLDRAGFTVVETGVITK